MSALRDFSIVVLLRKTPNLSLPMCLVTSYENTKIEQIAFDFGHPGFIILLLVHVSALLCQSTQYRVHLDKPYVGFDEAPASSGNKIPTNMCCECTLY